jgi:hypothetical protein
VAGWTISSGRSTARIQGLRTSVAVVSRASDGTEAVSIRPDLEFHVAGVIQAGCSRS